MIKYTLFYRSSTNMGLWGILLLAACTSTPPTPPTAPAAPATTETPASPAVTPAAQPPGPAPAAAQEIAALSKAAETIHDATMKEMSEMNRIKRQLKKQMEALAEKDAQRTVLRKMIAQMETAEAGMMDWMMNYQEPAASAPPAEAIRYLREQKTKIEKNQQDIHTALEASKKLLQQ